VTFESYDEAVEIRDALADRLEQAAVGLADAGDDAGYEALSALRLAVVRDVTARGGSLARIYRYAPPSTEPALVTAHRLYGDAGRAAEIVERNRVRHAGFVPGGETLEVLTDG
jgi:prophage DNA circulation protein